MFDSLLSDKEPRFSAEIAKVAKCESSEFADILFQPVPFSKNTPRGKTCSPQCLFAWNIWITYK